MASTPGRGPGAICGASLIPTIGRGHINLETGQFRRLAYGKQESDKRQPTVDLPPRLLAHIRRWHRLGISIKAVVEYQGVPVVRITSGWDAVVERAGLKTDIPQDKVIRHTLRHTAISWYLRSGVPPHQVSDYCGVSVQIIKRSTSTTSPAASTTCWHHRTDWGAAVPATQQKQTK